MKRIPSTITMMEFRAQPGEVIRAAEEGREILVTKNGKPVARIVPADDTTVISKTGEVISGPVPIGRPFSDYY